jgi:hypothetical protein
LYRESEVRLVPESKDWTPLRAADRDAYVQQVRQGLPLGGDYYLRRFPVWFDFRGNDSVLLSQAKALSAAGQLRGDLPSENLAEKQAQWLVGRNPFSTSLMYGEGYDWTPLYSVRSGQMVGALPVGMETKGVHDAPYWPTQICWTYKEVWVQPVGQWIWLMQDIAVPASVRGWANTSSNEPVEFREQGNGATLVTTLNSTDGSFVLRIPEGHYDVRQGKTHTDITVLPGGSYDVDLRPGTFWTFKVSSENVGNNEVVVRISAEGSGNHSFAIRTDNLTLQEPATQKIDLTGAKGGQAVWHARIASPQSPWVAVVVPDGALDQRREVAGAKMP